MSDEGWISIVDWEKEYQHYDPQKRVKDPRGPMPWIKNYTRLMQNDEYLELTEHCALVLHRLWLVYASSGCRLRADTRSLSRKTGLRVTKSHLDSLNHAGFVDIVASKESAEGYIPGSARATRDRSRGRSRSSSQDRSSRSEITSEPRPDLTESEDPHKDEQPFAREPEPELNGAGYDLPTIEQRPNLEPDDSMERLGVPADVEELVERWSGETA